MTEETAPSEVGDLIKDPKDKKILITQRKGKFTAIKHDQFY